MRRRLRVVQTLEQCCAQKTVFKISSAFTRMFMNSRAEAAVLILNFRALMLQERVAVTRTLAFANISGLKQMVLRRHPKKKGKTLWKRGSSKGCVTQVAT